MAVGKESMARASKAADNTSVSKETKRTTARTTAKTTMTLKELGKAMIIPILP